MASSSTTMPIEQGGEIIPGGGGSFFHDLPEGCIASIISFTAPTDACSLAAVSNNFLSASESDIVWERFLTSDYRQLIARSEDGEELLMEFHNRKKQLYLRLANRPLLIDDASKTSPHLSCKKRVTIDRAIMASSSTTMPIAEGGEIIPGGGGGSFFGDLPEGCIASIISFTAPTDACSLALVSNNFLSASESNIVWERFLPSDYRQLIARSEDGELLLMEFHNRKKQLYLRLTNRPLLIDDASKSFWLEKSTGKKCWMICARSMGIAWSKTPSHWKWISIPESRFPEVAQLISVCWLHIHGKILTSLLSPNTQYGGYLVFKTTQNASGFDKVLETSVHTARGEISTQHVYLNANRARKRPRSQRSDGWRELKIGEFFTHPGEEDDEVELAVKEVKILNWKYGLIVGGIEFRPI